MEAKYKAPFVYEDDDPEFEFLVCFSGSLVPIAKIIIIGQVVFGVIDLEGEDGTLTPLWGFPVLLTDSKANRHPRNNPQALYDGWDTQEEAEEQRRNLAVQVDNYYKKLLAGM